jgi:hypothetical protein
MNKVKYSKLGQWKLTPATDPYDAVDNAEKYANRDSNYSGISTQKPIDQDKARNIEHGYASAFKDHEQLKDKQSTKEPIVPGEIDLLDPVENLDGIEKHPPDIKPVGILFDGDGNRIKDEK